jgi:signal transduction histidine kinase
MPRGARAILGSGLGLRLLGALLLTSIVTLAVAALALLSPLEHKLRTESETSLYTAVHATRSEFGDIRLDRKTGLPEEQELRLTLGLLRHRSAAQVWVLTPNLQQVGRGAPSDLNVPTYYEQVRQALARGRGVHRFLGSLFVLAEPIRIGGRQFALVVMKRLDYVSSAVGVVQEAFIEAAAAGFGIAILLGIALTSTLLRRLRQLRDAARELERHGLSTQIRVKPGNDEIGELAHTLTSMQSRLRHQEAALHAFVATASHELRTPLASLDGMLELIADDLDGEHLDLEDARARTARAREQSRRLSRLASDLLDLSRLDAEVSLRCEPVELSELARAVAAELDLRANQRGVRLAVHASAAPAWADADPGAVARIVRILLDNALRFAPEGSAIDVDVCARAGGPAGAGNGAARAHDGGGAFTEVLVHDHGPGVPEQERELIFERFRRGAGSGGQGGFGLGLAIGRELAVRMGGSLELLEDAPSGEGGARFALRLPAAKMEEVPLSAVTGGRPALTHPSA